MSLWNKAPSRIYADAAAATPLSDLSRAEMMRLLDVYGNAGALHKEAVEAKRELDAARATIADSICAHPDEIIFTASGTEANNIAIDGILRPLLHGVGELHAITLAIEHQSVLEPLRALGVDGLYTTEMDVDEAGLVSLADLAEAITAETVFISVQLVNSEVGTIEPLKEVAKLVRQVRTMRQEALGEGEVALPLYLHTDASQAPFWVQLKVESLGIDLMTLDAQKVQGPKGVGVLYIKRHTDVEPVIRGGVQEFGLRGGTPNVPMAGAFAVAMKDAQEHVAARVEHVAAVRDFLYAEIVKNIPSTIVNGPQLGAGRAANNLNISIPTLDAETAVIAMDAEGVAISTRSACDTGDEAPSHVIAALIANMDPQEQVKRAKTAIRITLLPNTTKQEASTIADKLAEVSKRYSR
jgi:cysteine desulfurase